MTQIKTLPHEGAELKRKAGIVYLASSCCIKKCISADRDRHSQSWTQEGGRAVGTFLGCERNSQQWDVSELHWCAFSPSLIFIFTCHWPGNISVSVDSSLFPAVPTAHSKDRRRHSTSRGILRSLQVLCSFWHAPEHLKAALRCFPGCAMGPACRALQHGPFPGSLCSESWAEKNTQKRLLLSLLPPFYSLWEWPGQPIGGEVEAGVKSCSRSDWEVLNKLAGEVWCIKSYGSSLGGNYTTSVMMDKITTGLNKHSTSHQEFTSVNESCSTDSCNPLHSRLPQDWTPKCSVGPIMYPWDLSASSTRHLCVGGLTYSFRCTWEI